MNFKVKIFGTTTGFELAQGTEQEQNFFQSFYNGSQEKVKFVVNRLDNGMVAYTYLRYNFISGINRTGSFFGISLIFDNKYFQDVNYLFELFEAVYGSIIQNKVLLEDISNTSKSQGRFLVSSFAEVPQEIRRIESIISKNIENHQEDIKPLDNSFQKTDYNLARKLNWNIDNINLLRAIRQYTSVYISPEYKDEEVLSNEKIDQIKSNIKKINDNIKVFSIGALKGEEVSRGIDINLQESNNIMTILRKYVAVQPFLQNHIDNLFEYQSQLNEVKGLTKPKTQPSQQNGDKPLPEYIADTDKSSDNIPEEKKDSVPPVVPIWQKYRQQIWVASILLLISLIGGLAYYYYPKNKQKEDIITVEDHQDTNENNKDATQDNINKGNLVLAENKFEEAIKFFEDANQEEMVKNAKEKAKEYWSIKVTETTDLNQQLEYLQKVKFFGGYSSTDDDIANLKKRIKENNDKEATAQKKVSESKDKTKSANNQTKNSTTTTNASDIKDSCNDLKIILNQKKQVYKVGDTFTATAQNSDGSICKNGEWTFETGIWANKTQNPTTFEITSFPESGTAKLTYNFNNQVKSTVSIKVDPNTNP